jgi:plasmid replication initiation protein
MKSAYSIRLYELLCQWLSTGKKDVSVDWLREYWQLTDSYGKMCDLKRWVIDVSVREINEHSNIWVKYSQRKAGLTITHFIFEFGLKEAEKTTRTKANGTKQLVPDWNGHPTYEVDSKSILDEHKRLKTNPEPKPQKTLDSDKKSKITVLKQAIKHG